jgi:hypothetical protein
MIASATAQVEAARNLTSVSINMFPSLAVLWFMPKLSTYVQAGKGGGGERCLIAEAE